MWHCSYHLLSFYALHPLFDIPPWLPLSGNILFVLDPLVLLLHFRLLGTQKQHQRLTAYPQTACTCLLFVIKLGNICSIATHTGEFQDFCMASIEFHLDALSQ